MVEIDELRAKAIASMASSANPSLAASVKAKSPVSREEGELSSGDDPELPTCSTAPLSCTTLDELIATGPTPRDNLTQTMKSASVVNNVLTSGSSITSTQLPLSITRNYSKHLKTKQVPFKSRSNRSLSWHGKGSDDNLVISFSDDDSGNDSEDFKIDKKIHRKIDRAAKSKMPVASAKTQLEVSHRPSTHRTKLIPNKGVLSHSSVSSIPEVRGTSYSHLVASSAENNREIRRHTPVTKSSPVQVHEHVHDAHLADRELQSLRNQIAVRENELKVDSGTMLPSKGIITCSSDGQQGFPVMKVDSEAVGMSRSASIPTTGPPPNKQAMKRLKLDDHSKTLIFHHQLQKPIPSSEVNMEIHAMECREGEEKFIGKTDLTDRRHQEPNSPDCISSDALLNKYDEPLVSPTSVTARNLEVRSKHDSIFAAEVSCCSDQPGMRANPVDPVHVQKETLRLTQMETNVGDRARCQVDTPIRRVLSAESTRCSNISRGAEFSCPLRNKMTGTGVGRPVEASNQFFEKCSVPAPDPQLGHPDELDVSQMGRMHLELMKLEELQDKELEQAQELRRRCELEERRALRAYRNAQRALFDANDRCTRLYRKRELFSAQLRALTMEASSRQNQKEVVPYSAKPGPGNVLNRSEYEYNDQLKIGAYPQICRHDIGCDQCSEPDTSTPACTAASDIRATNNHLNKSADDVLNFPFDSIYSESRLANDANGGNQGGKPTLLTVERKRLISSENGQDYDLEATLRSKLVARLGAWTSSKINDVNNAEYDSTCDNKKALTSLELQLEEGEDKLSSDTEGIDWSERSNIQLTARFREESHGDSLSSHDESHRNIDPELQNLSPGKPCWFPKTTFSSLPSSNIHIVSRHAKLMLPDCFSGFPSKESGYMSRTSAEKVSEPVLDVEECTKQYMLRSPRAGPAGDTDSTLSDAAIDPFRPFCIFELRGKCNDKECPWQHVINCTNINITRNNHPVTSDGWASHSSTFAKSNDHDMFRRVLQVPAYKIGSDLINIDSPLSWSLLARSNWSYRQRGLCSSIPLPFSVQRILPPDAPFLQSDDGPVADHSRLGISLCVQSEDETMLDQALPDSEQSLENALDLFDGKICKADKNKLQALSLLSRAIEANPNSIVFWVVYLHVFYRKEKDIGSDDMFLTAVQHIEDSYDLWLMYINSRMRLCDRLNAYDYALTLLSQKKINADKDGKHASACILDIFLQMIDFLFMSGNLDKAVSRIYQLLPTTKNPGETLLSNVHSSLILSDKCMFWFSCTYGVVYGKLPEPVVRKFEFEKDLPFGLEWPSVQLPIDRKEQALDLMRVAVDSTSLDIDVDAPKRDPTDLRSLQFLAISHIRCVAALGGLQSSAELLVKYKKAFPTCIELVLLSARLQNCVGDDVFRGFEEAICNWPIEYSGSQCIWNQYAEHALENRGCDFTEKLLARWFQDFWKGKVPCTANLDCRADGQGSYSELPSGIQYDGSSHFLRGDDTYGFLNLFLYRLLQKNLSEAHLAINKALELATPMDYKHCVREHAAFIFPSESESQSSFHGSLCNLLNDYMRDCRASPMLETLSRRYCRTIKKPRIRQLINNFLGPVSRDFSLVNSVLEVCYGSSLIPEKFGEPKDLVDIVDTLMGTMPANYELALSVYRSACKNVSHTDVIPGGIRYWACSILVNSIIQAIPVAPEYVWLEVCCLLRNLENLGISHWFHQQALSIYPFSIKLWQSYLDLSQMTGNASATIEAAKERGVELAQTLD